MTEQNKVDVFESQLSLLADWTTSNIVRDELKKLPDAFFIKPASSTGYHHPPECRGEHGLVNHTKMAFNAGRKLLESRNIDQASFDHDIVLAAVLLHDGYKYGVDGSSEHTLPNHPQLYADYLLNQAKLTDNKFESNIYILLSNLIRKHHGIWGPANAQPVSELEFIVHYADYIASRLHDIKNLNL